jgi:hypothetical protein
MRYETAHARDHSGVLWFSAVEPCQYQVPARPKRAIQYAEDLYIHRFRLHTLKNRVGYSSQTAMYLVQWINACAGGRRGRRCLREQACGADEANRQNQPGCFLNTVSHVYRLAVSAAAA